MKLKELLTQEITSDFFDPTSFVEENKQQLLDYYVYFRNAIQSDEASQNVPPDDIIAYAASITTLFLYTSDPEVNFPLEATNEEMDRVNEDLFQLIYKECLLLDRP